MNEETQVYPGAPRRVLEEVSRAVALLEPDALVELYVQADAFPYSPSKPWGNEPLPDKFSYAVFLLSRPYRRELKYNHSQVQITQAALANATGELIAECLVEAVNRGISRAEVLKP